MLRSVGNKHGGKVSKYMEERGWAGPGFPVTNLTE